MTQRIEPPNEDYLAAEENRDLLHLLASTQAQRLTCTDRKCQHFNLNQA